MLRLRSEDRFALLTTSLSMTMPTLFAGTVWWGRRNVSAVQEPTLASLAGRTNASVPTCPPHISVPTMNKVRTHIYLFAA